VIHTGQTATVVFGNYNRWRGITIYATMIISIINYAYQDVFITMNATTMSSNLMSQIVGMLSGLTINNTSSDYVTTVCNNY
jgi:hypothetical protein